MSDSKMSFREEALEDVAARPEAARLPGRRNPPARPLESAVICRLLLRYTQFGRQFRHDMNIHSHVFLPRSRRFRYPRTVPVAIRRASRRPILGLKGRLLTKPADVDCVSLCVHQADVASRQDSFDCFWRPLRTASGRKQSLTGANQIRYRSINCLAMTVRKISLVPSPMHISIASR
jgi:hypothetical protein